MPRYGISRSRAAAAGEDLPLPPTGAEATGHEHPVHLLELTDGLLVRHVLRIHPANAHACAVMYSCVLQRLVHRQVRVVELDVLADERDLDLVVEVAAPLGELSPLAELGGAGLDAELLAHECVEALGLEHFRDHVDVGHVGRTDNRMPVYVGEQRDLLPDVIRERFGRATDDDVGMDADAAELVHRVLGRLRLQLACSVEERNERDVQIDNVLRARPPAGTGESPPGTEATRCRRRSHRSRRSRHPQAPPSPPAGCVP